MITIGIAEDQQIFRKGLFMLLNSFKGMKVICEGENGKALIDQFEKEVPNVVILDYSMPVMGGIEAAKHIRSNFPETKIILLSMYDDEEFIESAIESGANGYLSKDDDLNELEAAIKSVLSNHYYLNDRLSKLFINRMMSRGKIRPEFENEKVEFNEDEVSIIELISREHTNQEIADKLCKGVRTIEKYRSRMIEKVGAQNSVGLIMYAIKHKIIDLNSSIS
jgi:DNA-binding NarL/FixJ family response regulator